jgi:hypothetical protein
LKTITLVVLCSKLAPNLPSASAKGIEGADSPELKITVRRCPSETSTVNGYFVGIDI